MPITVMTGRTRLRVAVAEQEKQDVLAARLGRAVKFELFDARDGEIRGPFYRAVGQQARPVIKRGGGEQLTFGFGQVAQTAGNRPAHADTMQAGEQTYALFEQGLAHCGASRRH